METLAIAGAFMFIAVLHFRSCAMEASPEVYPEKNVISQLAT